MQAMIKGWRALVGDDRGNEWRVALKDGTHIENEVFTDKAEGKKALYSTMKEELKMALRKYHGNVSACARQFGLPLRSIYRWIYHFEIKPNSFRPEGWKHDNE